jgi:hypothetical protein
LHTLDANVGDEFSEDTGIALDRAPRHDLCVLGLGGTFVPSLGDIAVGIDSCSANIPCPVALLQRCDFISLSAREHVMDDNNSMHRDNEIGHERRPAKVWQRIRTAHKYTWGEHNSR